MVWAKSPNGKKSLNIIGKNGYFYAKWTGGGHLPKELEGKFTSRHVAVEKVNAYLARMDNA